MFHLYHHHDLGRLSELLGALLSRSEGGPLAAETVLVPNRGVGRWLQMQLAESEGVAANLHFPLPAKFFWQLLSRSLPDASSSSAYERENLRWHLYALLPDIAREVPRVAHYLEGHPAELRRWQLAEQLADIFDQYLIYRREMLAEWEAGGGEDRPPADWQAPVWRALVAQLGERHRARLLGEFVEAITRGSELATDHWPERIYCFGLGNLPPDYLRLLYALGHHAEVHFLLPNPSKQYWGDIDSRRVSLSMAMDEDAPPGEESVAEGHPLLGSLGRPARDFLRVLYSDELSAIHEPELGELMDYDPPTGDGLLHRVQHGIIRMQAGTDDQGKAADDASLQIHACHGPLREVQVLHDQILDRLSADPSLHPRDILVMLPDVARYAPAIHSVFGDHSRDDEQGPALPYTVSDQARIAAHPVARSVRELLELPLSRWTASEVMALASVPAVMRRFRLDEADLDNLRHWIQSAGVRWGLDADSRRQAGAGHWAQNTWQFGLDRLLLGLAQADEDTLVAGVAPWSELEGGGSEALGRLWLLVDRLRHWRDEISTATTAKAWRERLNTMLDELFAVDREDSDEVAALAAVHEAFTVLDKAHACLDEKSELSWEAVREALATELDGSGERQPFLGAGITFCGLVPLRAVPFRMVAVLGMNDGDFPRQDRNRSFNLIRRFPRLGDSSTRDDDRLLFLQALMAARDTFYVSYTGQDVRSGESLEPSPVVGELLDFLQRHHFAGQRREETLAQLITKQPMQPFSRRYFETPEEAPSGEARVFTFQGDWLPGTRAQYGERHPAPAFVDDSRVDAEEDTVLGLADLKRFIDHPARYFFRESLQLELKEGDEQLDDEEPRQLDGLTAHQLRAELFAQACRSGPLPPEPNALIRARGVLPPPPLDVADYQALAEDANALLPIWKDWHDNDDERGPLEVDITLPDGGRLRGVVNDVFANGLRRIHIGKLGMRQQLGFWIDYLALRAAGHDGELRCAGIEKGEVIVMQGQLGQASAKDQLQALLTLYREGRERPLPFMPNLAGQFIMDQDPQHKKKPDDPAKALKSRNGHLANSWHPAWEMQDPWFRQLVGPPDYLGSDPDSSEFCRVAQIVCGPVVNHLQTVEQDD